MHELESARCNHYIVDLQVNFTSKDLSEFSTKILRIGFREVELVQQKLPGGENILTLPYY